MSTRHQVWLARDMSGRLYAYDAEPSLVGMSDYVPASDADEIQVIRTPFEPLALCGQPPIEPGEKRLVTVTDATVTVEKRVPYQDALRETLGGEACR